MRKETEPWRGKTSVVVLVTSVSLRWNYCRFVGSYSVATCTAATCIFYSIKAKLIGSIPKTSPKQPDCQSVCEFFSGIIRPVYSWRRMSHTYSNLRHGSWPQLRHVPVNTPILQHHAVRRYRRFTPNLPGCPWKPIQRVWQVVRIRFAAPPLQQ